MSKVSVLTLLFLFASQDGVASQTGTHEAGTSLRLRLDATQATFPRADMVTLRVLIENGQPGCATRFLDRVISADPSPKRSLSHVELEIVDAGGKKVSRGTHSEPNWASMNERSLMRLDCWESFGRVVALASTEWGYRLPAGRYRVRARMTVKLREFFVQRPSLAKASAEWARMKPEAFLNALTDEVLESNEVEFEVRP